MRTPNTRGQAVVEYILLLVVVLAITTTVLFSFRKSIFAFWVFVAQQVAAACPGCQPPPEIRR